MKIFGVLLAAALISVPAFAGNSAAQRLQAATRTLHQLMEASDNSIPQNLLDKAECIVVVPNLKKGGFIIGGEYGKGFFTCRRKSGVGWSAPGAVRIAGGKFGLLIGGAETDVVMLVMNKDGMRHLLSNHFQLGGEASAAAGPVGRNASAMTDAAMHAEILTYSRQRGIFGGLDLSGATVTEDDSTNDELYGQEISNKSLINSGRAIPAVAKPFIGELNRRSSRK